MIANELRIGNWVQWNIEGGYENALVSAISKDEIFFKCGDSDIVERISGILLTEEWLFNFGFKKYEESDIPAYYKNFGSFLDDDYEYCFAIYQDIEENFYIQLIGKKIILKQVHKLQNVWFEITEEELNYKK